jgi:hypothetical protein
LIVIAVVLTSTGCDPTRTVKQAVVISVEIDANDGSIEDRPLETRQLSIRIRELWKRTAEDEEFYRFDPDRPIGSEWFSGPVRVDGSAVIVVYRSLIDGTRGNTPPVHRDAVTGRRYQVKVLDGKIEIASFEGDFVEGAIFANELLTLSVTEISKPEYAREEDR